MYKIKDNILKAIENSPITIRNVDCATSELIREKISELYCDNVYRTDYIWEYFSKYESISDDNAWSFIEKFVGEDECILFFNQRDEKVMFHVNSGNDLNYILSETYGFEFYVTNALCSYLICFSHHNVLYGCGSAIDWIIQNMSPEAALAKLRKGGNREQEIANRVAQE